MYKPASAQHGTLADIADARIRAALTLCAKAYGVSEVEVLSSLVRRAAWARQSAAYLAARHGVTCTEWVAATGAHSNAMCTAATEVRKRLSVRNWDPVWCAAHAAAEDAFEHAMHGASVEVAP